MKRLYSLKPGTIFLLDCMYFKLISFGEYFITLVRFYSVSDKSLLIPVEIINLPISFIKKSKYVDVLNCTELSQRNSIHCFYRVVS